MTGSARRVLAQSRWEVRAVFGNGEQLLLTIIIPLVLLVGLARTSLVDVGSGDRLSLVVAGVLTVAVMSTAFTSLAIGTAFDRRSDALALLGTTPLTRAEWGAARVLAVVLVELVQGVLIITIAIALGWTPSGLLAMAGLVLLGTAAFGALGLLLGGTVRAEAVLAIANGVYLILLFAGGTIIAAAALPGPLAAIAPLLPSGALGDALRSSAAGDPPGWASIVVLTVWAVLAGALTAKFFRWRSS